MESPQGGVAGIPRGGIVVVMLRGRGRAIGGTEHDARYRGMSAMCIALQLSNVERPITSSKVCVRRVSIKPIETRSKTTLIMLVVVACAVVSI
jgi:hypothetical protein